MVELSDTVRPEGKVAASYELHKTLENLADTKVTDSSHVKSLSRFDTTGIRVLYSNQ